MSLILEEKTTSFKDKLYKIYKDVEMRTSTRDDAYERIVSERLAKSLNTYMDSLSTSVRYIGNSTPLTAMKKLTRDKA